MERKLNGLMVIPTGLGLKIGGHAGDSTPEARMLAAACGNLVIHPNVVNASDICETTPNMQYVEGGTLDRWLDGEVVLAPPPIYGNKILLVLNPGSPPSAFNAANAANATAGLDVTPHVLESEPILLKGWVNDSVAVGRVGPLDKVIIELREVIDKGGFDAVAVSSEIDVPKEIKAAYVGETYDLKINPWGKAEAMLSRQLGSALNIQVAHAPIEEEDDSVSGWWDKQIVDPRMAAEFVSVAYLFCVLKGLSMAPRIADHGYDAERYLDVLISPDQVWGTPQDVFCKWKRPVIVVRENHPVHAAWDVGSDGSPWIGKKNVIFAETYCEAAGILCAMRAGVRSIWAP